MKRRRRVGAYMNAIRWVALNDDTEFLNDDNPSPSVSICLVADIFDRTVDEAVADLRAELARIEAYEARSKAAQAALEETRARVRAQLAAMKEAQ